jgi:hypothetical protein
LVLRSQTGDAPLQLASLTHGTHRFLVIALGSSLQNGASLEQSASDKHAVQAPVA